MAKCYCVTVPGYDIRDPSISEVEMLKICYQCGVEEIGGGGLACVLSFKKEEVEAAKERLIARGVPMHTDVFELDHAAFVDLSEDGGEVK